MTQHPLILVAFDQVRPHITISYNGIRVEPCRR